MSGFELDFNVESILHSLIFQIKIVNQVGMANKSYRESIYLEYLGGKNSVSVVIFYLLT